MSLLDTIVSALRSLTGGGTQSTDSADTDTHREGQVSVENDPETDRTVADTSTEAAVKGTDPETPGGTEGDGGDSDAVAAGTDAAASTGTLVDEDAGGEPAETVGQPGGVDADRTAVEIDDASEDGSDDAGEDEAEDAAETADGDSETAAAETANGDSDEPVQSIKGIGPAYAERLETIEIETVGELAVADAAAVAGGIEVSESRVSDWIERARDAS